MQVFISKQKSWQKKTQNLAQAARLLSGKRQLKAKLKKASDLKLKNLKSTEDKADNYGLYFNGRILVKLLSKSYLLYFTT